MSQRVDYNEEQIGRYYIEFINKLIDEQGKRVSKISELSDGVKLSVILSSVM